MKKFTIIIAILFAIGINAIGQVGWTMVSSDLPANKGIGQISIGINDNTAMWAMAINDDGSIFDAFTRSIDGGNTWESGTFNAGSGLSQIFAIDADICWAVFNTGATQGLYKTEDGGATWVKKGGVYGSGSFANVIHFFNDNDGFAQGDAVGTDYECYTTDDGGETWTAVDGANIPVPTSGEFGITGNYCAFGDNIWWGTNQGRIYRSTDKGYTWEVSLTAFGATEVVAPLMFDADNGIAFRSYLDLGVESVLNETNDGGATWTSFNTTGASFARFFAYVPGTVNTVIGSAHNVTAGEGISISEDGGYNWTEWASGYPFMASAWLDNETGWCGTLSTGSGTDGMYIYDNTPPPPGPTNVEAMVEGDDDVHVTWNAPAGGGDMVELSQHDGNAENAYFQAYDNGYGVVYDLSAYPGATLELFDFRHSPWGVFGTWDYKIRIVDWDTYTEVYVSDVLQTTGDDQWEEGISLGSMAESGMVGIFIEPMSNDAADAYPCIDGDNIGPDGMSYTGVLGDYSAFTLSTIGDFLMDLWVMTPEGKILVKPPKVQITEPGTAIARNATTPLTGTEYTLKQTESSNSAKSVLEGYNVFRNGDEIAYVAIPTTEYDDMDLDPGTYEYCVSAVYDDAESQPVCAAPVTIENIVPPGPTNLVGPDAVNEGNPIELYWDGPGSGEWIHWDTGENTGNGIGLTGGGTFSCASRWFPADLTNYNGLTLSVINFFANGDPDAVYVIKVWTGATGSTEVHSQDVASFNVDEWNEVTLTTPIVISSAVDFWFGYEVTHGADMFPGACDDGPAIPYNGDMISTGGGWVSMSTDYGLDYNWNIQGWVALADGKVAEPMVKEVLPTATSTNFVAQGSTGVSNKFVPTTTNSKDLESYNVYRAINGAAFSVLDNVTETEYTDTDVTVTGQYEYYVTAVWDPEGESDPSNYIMVDVMTGIEDVVFRSTAIYPNPASEVVNIKSDFDIESVSVFNHVGQVISTEKINTKMYQINTSQYTPGMYFFQIETTEGTISKRIVVQ